MLPAGSTTRHVSAQHGVVVLVVETDPERVVRAAVDPKGRESIGRHRRALVALRDDPRCAALLPILPEIIRCDPEDAWLVESVAPGESDSAVRRRALVPSPAAALTALDQLHESTELRRVVDDDDLDAWVAAPIRLLRGVVRGSRGLDALEQYLRQCLLGRTLTVAHIHGDATPGNFLFSPDGKDVTGIIDWEASGFGLPDVDLAHYLFAERFVTSSVELGADVANVLRNGWSADERDLLSSHSRNDDVSPEAIVLLAWLHHVANNLRKSARYARHRWWVHSNIIRVLAAVEDEGLLPRPAEGDALVTDLTLHADDVFRLLQRETEAEHWLDAFLLVAGASQIVDDALRRRGHRERSRRCASRWEQPSAEARDRPCGRTLREGV